MSGNPSRKSWFGFVHRVVGVFLPANRSVSSTPRSRRALEIGGRLLRQIALAGPAVPPAGLHDRARSLSSAFFFGCIVIRFDIILAKSM